MNETDFIWRKAKSNGRMSTAAADIITDNARENVFDRVQRTEREDGSVVTEKIFLHNANDDDEPLYGARPWLDMPSDGDDYEHFVAGSQTNVEADLTGSERIYATAALKTDVSSGASSAVFTLEDADLADAFADTYDCVLSARPDGRDDTTGTEEELTISGTPSLSGTDLTITFSTTLQNNYTVAAGTRISVLYDYGDLETVLGTVEADAGNTGSGVLDDTQITLDNLGTVEQTLTLAFTDSTTFTVTSDDTTIGTAGVLASGSTGSDYAPLNPDNSKPYLTIPAAAWSGTPAAGDEWTVQTSPSAIPFFVTRTVPASSGVGYSVPQIVCEGDY